MSELPIHQPNQENLTEGKETAKKAYFQVDIELVTVSEANQSEHWSVKHKRHKKQKEAIQWSLWKDKVPLLVDGQKCSLTFCRIAPRKLDSDNLVSCFKAIRDAVCDYLRPGFKPGRADSDAIFTFDYKQLKSEPYDNRVQIEIVFT